jgi:PAS domain S-box-containing protein
LKDDHRHTHGRHCILVIEDDVQMRRTLGEVLHLDDFEVLSAENSTQALDLLREELPCMILLDVELPGVNGFELCRRIKQAPRTARIPVVMVTARLADKDIQEGLSAGAVDYIKKPFDIDEFRLRVRMQVRASEAMVEQQRLHQKLSVISSAANDAMIIIEGRGKIAHWNEAARRIFGYTHDEAIGQDLHRLLAPNRFHERQDNASPWFQSTGQGAALGKTLELAAIRKSGEEFPIELSLASSRIDDEWCEVGIIRDITERKQAETGLRDSEERYRTIFNASHDAIMMIAPPEWRFLDANPATLAMFGAKTVAEFISCGPIDLSPEKQHDGRPSGEAAQERIQTAMRDGSASFEWTHRRMDGHEFSAMVNLSRLTWGGKDILLSTVRDLSHKRALEVELSHARKLEAVGQLASGIAHEINTPAQYVGDGLQFLREAFEGYQRLVSQYQGAVVALERAGGHETLVNEIHAAEQDIDLAYLAANAPASFESCLDGMSRISTIVHAMKEFAHPDRKEKTPADLNHALQTTLAIARNEYKYVADVTTDFGDLPAVLCHPGDLNQVFLNLLVNAAHAIGDVVGKSGCKGTIRIRTSREADLARIDIGDTGSGIPEKIRQRVFDPFFTTKEVGKGTGQGLAIARSIVVTKHGGSLTFESEVGKGTTFTIRLPIDSA